MITKKAIIISMLVGLFLSLPTIIVWDTINSRILNKTFIKEKLKTNPSNCKNNYYIKDETMFFNNLNISEQNQSDCIIHSLRKNKIKNIFIYESQGGLSIEAATIGNYIKNNNINVHVENSCLSACTYFLFSSSNSSVSYYSLIGIHKTYSVNKFDVFLNKISFGLIFSNLEIKAHNTRLKLFDSDFGFDFYNEKAGANIDNKIYIIHPDDLIRYNMIDTIVKK